MYVLSRVILVDKLQEKNNFVEVFKSLTRSENKFCSFVNHQNNYIVKNLILRM